MTMELFNNKDRECQLTLNIYTKFYPQPLYNNKFNTAGYFQENKDLKNEDLLN